MMNILFLNIMIVGTFISISAYSWINIWIGLEMNLMAFITLINSDNMKQSSEVAIKYFLVQVSASMLILFAFLNSYILLGNVYDLTPLSKFIFNSAILLKMGAAPFHMWYPSVAMGLSWINLLIMMTWQKIAPMILIMYNFEMNSFFCTIILLSITISGLKIWNQTSMKKILALSSINHMGWMMAMMFLNQSLWAFYFTIYIFITTNLVLVLNKYNINTLEELFMLYNSSKTTKFFFFLNLFSLGGVPPFIGFFPKWMVLKILLENELYFLAFLIVLLTMLSLYIYIRMTLQPLSFKNSDKKNIFKNSEFKFIFFMNWFNITGIIIFTIIFNNC
uniref:NADH dehydrogenase subunit 2 n=1 Tax=Megalocaria dilatata TaxID=511882 RepID=UPI002079E8E5|nr:NADH dehydrogenase subunit 2 [Megalocaria dilatata]URN72796.1 NADH dehydrogenase subunit 2 [Megalocaria dilatata]